MLFPRDPRAPLSESRLFFAELTRLLHPEGRTVKLSPVPLWTSAGDRECCAPAYFEGSIMPKSQRLSSVIPFAAIGRPACPKCKAPMMLISIEIAGPGVDLHTFECAICNSVLKTLAAYEDPMKSKALGRWLQGELHPPR
jgi:hypothetical protein